MSFQSLVHHKFIRCYIVEDIDLKKVKLNTTNPVFLNVRHIEALERIKKQPVDIYTVKMVGDTIYQVWFDPPLSNDTIKLN